MTFRTASSQNVRITSPDGSDGRGGYGTKTLSKSGGSRLAVTPGCLRRCICKRTFRTGPVTRTTAARRSRSCARVQNALNKSSIIVASVTSVDLRTVDMAFAAAAHASFACCFRDTAPLAQESTETASEDAWTSSAAGWTSRRVGGAGLSRVALPPGLAPPLDMGARAGGPASGT